MKKLKFSDEQIAFALSTEVILLNGRLGCLRADGSEQDGRQRF